MRMSSPRPTPAGNAPKNAPKGKGPKVRPWSFAGGTDVGRERAHNEDAILVDPERKLVVLADGMGGYQAGEVASQLAVDIVREESADLTLSDRDLGRVDPDTGMSVAMRQLRRALNQPQPYKNHHVSTYQRHHAHSHRFPRQRSHRRSLCHQRRFPSQP